ncbi:hypothetical protein GPAL_3374 [Glaciecola pallidula DSM 14239 = ACAM 615]|uniref:Uncharacterized protein n=1 Tax=Brumicola pallidula DSM 14239 = ACAM 615 TaxID=1121922 RepID=K6ZIN2_9ALTE|nr:hypothetical protein GPAL_3374 [Glaciecola pallidula DSM 14239 = ACAM 615]
MQALLLRKSKGHSIGFLSHNHTFKRLKYHHKLAQCQY